MGLMIYAFATSYPIADVDFQQQSDCVVIFVWRRHWAFARWLEALYGAKGGARWDSGTRVRIGPDDLDTLERSIELREIPAAYERYVTLWDSSEPSDKLAFIRIARMAIDQGGHVYCACHW